MKQVLRCSAGHEWGSIGDEPDADDSATCPVCGQAANTLILPARDIALGNSPDLGLDASPAGATDDPEADATRIGQHAAPEKTSTRAEEPWPTVPGYEILAELGRGGMGVVYKARQTSLRRLVAIKLFLSGSRERFRLEAEAIARLQHPNIVQIYEVGETQRGPYYSQEYIAGGSLADCLDGTPWPAAKAARLMSTLAKVMQFTHERHIVHRDLKPANVLLSDGHTPKVSDFGLAKELDRDSGQTATGDIMGSPSYMAPEQAGGVTKNITRSADIYALGAILYELLTGRPPFHGTTALDTVFQVLSTDPIPLRRLQPKLPGDLETICLKCLEKSPRARYASAQELADDLRRFLAGEPIHARPVSIWMRGVKWARRRPGLAVAVGTAALATLLLIVGGVVYNVRLSEALRVAGAEKRQREATLVQAQDVIDRLLSGFSEQRLARLPHSESLRRELLASALKLCQDLQSQNPDQPELRWQVGRSQRQAADLQAILGQSAEADESYARAIKSLTALVADDPRAKYQRELAGAHHNLAVHLMRAGQASDAEREYARAIERVLQWAAVAPDDSDVPRQLARAWDNLGVASLADGRPEAAAEPLEAAHSLLERLAAHSADASLRLARAKSFNNLGMLHQTNGKSDEAERAFEQARQLFDELASEAPDDPEYRLGLASTAANLAIAGSATHSAAETNEAFDEALAAFERLARDFPAVEDYRTQWALMLDNYALIREHIGDTSGAADQHEQAQKLYEQLVGQKTAAREPRARLAANLNRQGNLAIARQDLAAADELISRAMEMQAALVREIPDRAGYQNDLALSCESAGKLMLARQDATKAKYYFDLAINHQRQAMALAPACREFAVALRQQYSALATALLELGELEQAAQMAEQLAAIAPRDRDAIAQAAGLLARCIPLVDRFKASVPTTLADDCARRAVELLRDAAERSSNGDGPEKVADTLAAEEFGPLRDREDFQALKKQIERAAEESK